MNLFGTIILIAVLAAVGYFVYWAIKRTMQDQGSSVQNRQRRARR